MLHVHHALHVRRQLLPNGQLFGPVSTWTDTRELHARGEYLSVAEIYANFMVPPVQQNDASRVKFVATKLRGRGLLRPDVNRDRGSDEWMVEELLRLEDHKVAKLVVCCFWSSRGEWTSGAFIQSS